MAILKAMVLHEASRKRKDYHLKNALEYICNPEKCALIKGMFCRPEDAFCEMKETKKSFNKTEGRQGYHMVISLPEDEDVPAEVLTDIAEKFISRITPSTEAVIAVHNNTDKLHAHIVFNSINFADGHKFHMKDGDMELFLRRELDELLAEHGLEPVKRKSDAVTVPGGKARYDTELIRRDFDECKKEAEDYAGFIRLLEERGYTVKNAGLSEDDSGKYLSVIHEGMERFRRCKDSTLGSAYTREALKSYFEEKSRQQNMPDVPVIKNSVPLMPETVKCRVRHYRKAKLSPIQKRYLGRLYRAGVMKHRAYSVAWKYRDDIREFTKLQEEYLMIKKAGFDSVEDVEEYLKKTVSRESSLKKEKALAVKERKKMQPVWEALSEMERYADEHELYLKGDNLFKEEHEKYREAEAFVLRSGYSPSEAAAVKENIERREAWAVSRLKNGQKEKRTAAEILRRLRLMEQEREDEREDERKKENSPDMYRVKNPGIDKKGEIR